MKRINIETTTRCTLKCPACVRQHYYTKNKRPILGTDISLKSLDVITDYYDNIGFCGNFSDPTTHPDLYSLLKMCIKKSKRTSISVASTHRSLGWFRRHFLLTRNKDVIWEFAIDGLPKDSHKYRINQDGEKLFDIMRVGRQLGCQVVWKYIVFNYNEDSIEEAYRLANSINVRLDIIKSVRWEDDMVKYKPKKEENYITRPFERSKYS